MDWSGSFGWNYGLFTAYLPGLLSNAIKLLSKAIKVSARVSQIVKKVGPRLKFLSECQYN